MSPNTHFDAISSLPLATLNDYDVSKLDISSHGGLTIPVTRASYESLSRNQAQSIFAVFNIFVQGPPAHSPTQITKFDLSDLREHFCLSDPYLAHGTCLLTSNMFVILKCF